MERNWQLREEMAERDAVADVIADLVWNASLAYARSQHIPRTALPIEAGPRRVTDRCLEIAGGDVSLVAHGLGRPRVDQIRQAYLAGRPRHPAPKQVQDQLSYVMGIQMFLTTPPKRP